MAKADTNATAILPFQPGFLPARTSAIARRAVLRPAVRRARHGRGCQRHGDRRHEVTPVAAIAAPAIIPATPIAESAELELGQDLGRLEEAFTAARERYQAARRAV
jgi:hypothetical protein